MKKILLFLLICLFISCKKEKADNSATFHSVIIIDSASNSYISPADKYPSITVIFHIHPSDNYNQEIIAKWVNPDSLIGFGPFKMFVADSLSLKVKLQDQEGSTLETLSGTIYQSVINDSILPVFDYRDRILGKYNCIERYTWPSSDSNGNIIWITDTSGINVILETFKSEEYNYGFNLKGPFWNLTAFLKNDYTFHQINYYTPDHGHFYANDSIYCWVKYGAASNLDYFGKRLISK